MEKSYSESYAAAGVDITAGYRSVELMKQYVARTMNEHMPPKILDSSTKRKPLLGRLSMITLQKGWL